MDNGIRHQTLFKKLKITSIIIEDASFANSKLKTRAEAK